MFNHALNKESSSPADSIQDKHRCPKLQATDKSPLSLNSTINAINDKYEQKNNVEAENKKLLTDENKHNSKTNMKSFCDSIIPSSNLNPCISWKYSQKEVANSEIKEANTTSKIDSKVINNQTFNKDIKTSILKQIENAIINVGYIQNFIKYNNQEKKEELEYVNLIQSELEKDIQNRNNYETLIDMITNDINPRIIDTKEVNSILKEKLPNNTFYDSLNDYKQTENALNETNQHKIINYQEKAYENFKDNKSYEEFLRDTRKKEIILTAPYANTIINRSLYPHALTEYYSNKTKKIYSIEQSMKSNRLDEILRLLNLDHLSNIERESAVRLISVNEDRFHLKHEPLPYAYGVKHKIDTIHDKPINIKQYRCPIHLREEIDNQIQELLKNDIIEESFSGYNFPVIAVPKKKKKDGKEAWRIVFDYRRLNDVTKDDVFPMPDINQILTEVKSVKYYTTLDLSASYHQILLNEEDRHKTSFSSHDSKYHFKRMPFGLKSAPSTLQRFINKVLKGVKNCFVFMDDILIFSQTLEEHEMIFNEVMRRLRKANLCVQSEKCEILKDKVCYLGHIISEQGIHPNPEKVSAVKNFPKPRNVKNIRQFIGIANYYRKYIQNFAKIAKPLFKLLEKDAKFNWNEDAEKAFIELKDRLCSAPVLRHPNFNEQFIITVDSSGYALGAVLSQKIDNNEHPIAYASRVLTSIESGYSTYEKEALGILFGIESFKQYVYNRKFLVLTDHKPLTFSNKLENNRRVLKWRHKLSDMNYEVKFKEGVKNTVADGLSRCPVIDKHIHVVTRAQKRLENLKNVPTPKNPELNDLKTNDENIETSIKHFDYTNDNINNNERHKNTNKKEARKHDITPENKNKVGRPRKIRLEKPIVSSYDAESESEDMHNNVNTQIHKSNKKTNISDTETKLTLAKIKYVKDLLQYRKDNILYFINDKGEPLEKGAKNLIESGRIEIYPEYEINTINIQTFKKKKYYGICLNIRESIKNICTNFKMLFEQLITKFETSPHKTVSISINESIGTVPFNDILNIIHDILVKTEIILIICKGTLTYLPPEKRADIFKELHASAIGGHRGISSTVARFKQRYYYENMRRDIQKRILQCVNCQLRKLSRIKTKMPMIISDTQTRVFEKVSLDIVGKLRKSSDGSEYILTIQDHLSKYVMCAALKTTDTQTVANAFIKKFICVFGSPRYILTDNGSNFVSSLMKAVAKRFKIKKDVTSSYHPEGNASLERWHFNLAEFLRQYTDKISDWHEWIDLAALNYNSTVHASHKYTPYELIFGHLIRLPSEDPIREYEKLTTYKDYLINLVKKLHDIRVIAHENLIDAKVKSKKYYDQKLHVKEFKVGDKVSLLFGKKPNKLDNPYTGPFQIIKKLKNNNFTIMNIKTKKTDSVNSKRLKPYFEPDKN